MSLLTDTFIVNLTMERLSCIDLKCDNCDIKLFFRFRHSIRYIIIIIMPRYNSEEERRAAILESKKNYYYRNRDKQQEKSKDYCKQYYEANKDRLRETARARYHQKKAAVV